VNGAGRADASPTRGVEHMNVAQVPRLALSVEEACRALGVSWDFWREHVAPGVRIVRAGRRKLVPVAALERWLDDNAETVLRGSEPRPAAKSLENDRCAPTMRQSPEGEPCRR
jgi:hypothetical protein